MELSQTQIKNGWKVVRFKDFVALNRGFDLPIQDRVFGKYPVVASTSITDYHSEFKVKGPVVTTGRSGALGEVLYTANDCWPLNTSLYSKDFYGNNPRFVYFKLKTLEFGKYNSGSGVPTLNKNHLDSIEIEIPEIKTQNRIADVLSAYDDLIENNEKRIKILEAMAQKLYTEWFVKFKFPGHEKVKMVDSGNPDFGLVPEGWEVKKLKDFADLVMGQSPTSDNYNFEKIGKPFHQGVADFGDIFPLDRVWSNKGNKLAQQGDLLFDRKLLYQPMYFEGLIFLRVLRGK